MTFNLFHVLALVTALVALYLGWVAAHYLWRVLVVLGRLSVGVCFATAAVYLLYCAWPYLVQLQETGQVYFPREVISWHVVSQ